jgi:hypothetical protein
VRRLVDGGRAEGVRHAVFEQRSLAKRGKATLVIGAHGYQSLELERQHVQALQVLDGCRIGFAGSRVLRRPHRLEAALPGARCGQVPAARGCKGRRKVVGRCGRRGRSVEPGVPCDGFARPRLRVDDVPGPHESRRADRTVVGIDIVRRLHVGVGRSLTRTRVNHRPGRIQSSLLEVAIGEPGLAVAAGRWMMTVRRHLPPHDAHGVLVRGNQLVPHAEREEDVRRHVLRVTCVGRVARERARSLEASRRVGRVVHSVDKIMRRSGVIGVTAEDLVREIGGPLVGRHVAHALVESQQRERVEELRLVVAGIGRGQLGHRGLEQRIPGGLRPWSVQQLDRVQVSGLALRPRGFATRGRRRREFRKHGSARVRVLDVPDRVVPGHRLTPIRHRKAGIGLLCLAERFPRFPVVKEVQQECAPLERPPRTGRAGCDGK